MITHFRTASLILGRSGTGKTTCLVFKLVGKFLRFQETVDKLDPEMFCGVQSDILCSKDVDRTEFSAGITDFGAEQVILVRDTHIKSNLQDQICDVPLILTILESRGMEFDDVILWSFFTVSGSARNKKPGNNPQHSSDNQPHPVITHRALQPTHLSFRTITTTVIDANKDLTLEVIEYDDKVEDGSD